MKFVDLQDKPDLQSGSTPRACRRLAGTVGEVLVDALVGEIWRKFRQVGSRPA
jgi:hypothetical protein